MQLEDKTSPPLRFGRRWHNTKANVIYKTPEGWDYCRETAPASIATHDEAVVWANARWQATGSNPRIVAFAIEWF